MKTISTMSHRDGAALVIGESPWFIVALDNIVGSYNPHWMWDYRIWNAILGWCTRWERELIRVPIEHSCEAAEKIWGNSFCYHDETEGNTEP